MTSERTESTGQTASSTARASSALKDARHLIRLGILLLAVGSLAVWVRGRLVPVSFGEKGPYRAEALKEIAAQPSVIAADDACHACHQQVAEERANSRHKAVLCIHCHGIAVAHRALAEKALHDTQVHVEPAVAWDGNLATNQDLFISKDRRLCLVCHESVVGMPADFRKIDVAQHLEEMGAEDPQHPETCFQCHGGHDTAPH